MDYFLRQAGNSARFFGVSLLGFCFALALSQVWELDTRWLVIILVGIAATAISMCLVRIFSDFLLVVSLFSLSFASFSKWFWSTNYTDNERGNLVYFGALGIGLIDFLLVGLYISWFYRIFVTRQQPPPRLNLLDGLILWFVFAHLLSIIGSADTDLGFSATEFLVKYVLFYFYISRNLEERHLPWLLAAFAFTIFVQASLGSYQFTTGRLLGIGLDKGLGSSDVLNSQYKVPGAESYYRATGTAYDSHALGHLVALILPFPMVLFFTPQLRPMLRFCSVMVSTGAVLVIILSLSRSAWLSSIIALTIGPIIIIAIWRERQVVPALASAAVLAAVVAPFIANFVYERFAQSPFEVLTTRFDQYYVGWRVFTLYPSFGVGPGNWFQALRRHDYLWITDILPIHNVILQIATEIGIAGLLGYFGMLATIMLRLFSLVRSRRDIAARLALAALLAMITTVLDGLTDPLFREPNVFLMFWLLAALSVALPRLRLGAGEVLMVPGRAVANPASA